MTIEMWDVHRRVGAITASFSSVTDQLRSVPFDMRDRGILERQLALASKMPDGELDDES